MLKSLVISYSDIAWSMKPLTVLSLVSKYMIIYECKMKNKNVYFLFFYSKSYGYKNGLNLTSNNIIPI